MRGVGRCRTALAIAAAIASWSSSAVADDVARAKSTFAEGIRLYRAGDWEGARRAFREADADHHAPAIVYNIGLAEEMVGHTQAAVDAYEAYVAETGEHGEFLAASVAAIARIKARATKLRIETSPPGAHVFVDGMALAEPAPTTLLVRAGHHVVVAQGEAWHEERLVETTGTADMLTVAFVETTPVPAPDPPRPNEPERTVADTAEKRPAPAPSLPPPPPAPHGLIWGLSFSLVPTYFLGSATHSPPINPYPTNDRDAVSFFVGPLPELGWAVTEKVEVLFRGIAALSQVGKGPSGHDPSTVYMGGPAISYHVLPRFWIGANAQGGRADTMAHGASYGTDQVLGTMLEANYAVVQEDHGEWLLGVQPAVLWANQVVDNFGFFFPITFGYRAY